MNVPKLRFKEFRDDWLTSELDEIATTSSGGTPNRAKPEYWGGSIPWVTTSLIDFNVIINSDEFITEEGLKNSSAKLFPKDTLLMAMYGQGKTRGKVAILGLEASTNQACAAIAFHQNTINIQFAFQNLAGRYDEIRDLSNAGGQENLSAGLIKQIQITFPRLSEQTKIANFLTAIDEKISQLTQKYDLLKQYKKGVMQQIFSQKLRFKDDNGREFPEWETVRLGDIASFSKGKGISKADISTDGKTLCIRYGELYTEYGETIQKIKSKTNINPGELQLSESNDVIIPASGETQIDIAKASCVLIRGVALGGDLNIIKSNENGVFLSYYLNHQKKLDIAKLAQGNSVVHLYSSQLKLLDLIIPSKPEQTKIANFFTAIDDKITQTQTQLDAVKRYKKGLLQQLFV